jgi:hypothetical protein
MPDLEDDKPTPVLYKRTVNLDPEALLLIYLGKALTDSRITGADALIAHMGETLKQIGEPPEKIAAAIAAAQTIHPPIIPIGLHKV